MKRIIAILLCTIMICSTLPVGVQGATVVASGKAGDGISWSLDSDGHLTLWGSGETYNFAYYDYPVPWREYRTDIKTVTVGEGITVLHQNTFGGCSNMTELTLPSTLTNITGNVTFLGCDNLKKVHISDLDAWCRLEFGLVSHQEAACPLFSGADLYLNGEAVTEIVIPDGVTTMWSHQYSFPSLEKITLPDSMTTVSAYTLKRCKNVEVHISSLEQWLEIDFRLIVSGPLDNNSTLYIDGEPLTALTVPDGITSIPKSAFFGYDKLTYLDLNDVVTVGEYAFYKCEGLTTLDMAEAETLQDSSFYGCDGLKEIYISPKLKDSEGLRNSAENVEKVYIRDLYAFCTTTGTINSLYYGDEFGLYYNGELLTHVEIPEGIEDFNNRAFADYERLESVTFPEGTTEIGASSFSYCKMLKEVDLPDTLTTIGKNAFYNTSLTSVDIPDGVEHISEGAFAYIDEMTTVDLPDNCITIGDSAFSSNSIESIEFPDTLTSIGRSAFDYNELKEVTIPDSVTYIGEYAFEGNRDLVIYCSIGSCADRYATANGITVRYTTQSKSVKVNTLPDKTVYNVYDTFDPTGLSLEVEFDDGSKQIVSTGYTVGEYDFSTPGKKTVTVFVSGGSTTLEVDVLLQGQCGESAYWSISDGVFTLSGEGEAVPVYIEGWDKAWSKYADSITRIIIGDKITSIGYRFFEDFVSVKELTIPASVELIEGSTFSSCTSLTDVYFEGSPDMVDEWAFNGCTALKNVYVSSLDNWFNIGFKDRLANPLYYADNLYIDGHRQSNVQVPEGVTKIYPCAFDFAFLKKVTLSNTVTEIDEDAFRGTDELISLRIPLSVKTIHTDAFDDCGENVKIYCPVGAYVAEYAHEHNIAYEYTEKVKEVTIATAPYKTDYHFYDELMLDGLTLEVTFENGTVITTDHNYVIEEYALNHEGVNEITLHYKDKSVVLTVYVTIDEPVAKGACGERLTWALYENGYLDIRGEGTMFSFPWIDYAESIKTIVIGEGVTTICQEAFKNCRNISAIYFPSSMEFVGYSVFDSVPYVGKMYIPSIRDYCEIDFEHVLSSPLSREAEFIIDGEVITDLVIPEGVEHIGSNQFYNSYFTSVNLPSTLKSIGSSAFSSMENLTEIHIPDSVTEIGNFAFYTAPNLREVTGGNGVTYIGISAFDGTPFIDQKEVYVGDTLIHVSTDIKGIYSVDYGTKAIGMYAFKDCKNITLIILPNTVTKIGWGAFEGCTKLKEVMMPESVADFDSTAFDRPYNVVIRCKEGSRAAEIAMLYNIPYVYYETKVFADVNEKAWYADAVTYCTERGYISGMSDNSFAPNNNLTREQFVMILSQVAGVDTEQYKNLDDGFADTKSGMWYSGAVYWAVNEKLVTGVSTDRFGLGQNITREQLARLFYLYAESVGMDVTSRADLSKFADSSKISSWASEQIKWAVSAGLISGMSEDTLSPKGTATRAQAARIFMLFDRMN